MAEGAIGLEEGLAPRGAGAGEGGRQPASRRPPRARKGPAGWS
jgi:hypothetical protein